MQMRYCVQWKDLDDPSKGTLWTYMPEEIKDFAKIPSLEEGMDCMMSGHRPYLCRRGTKWKAIWPDGTTYAIRSSPKANKTLLASIAKRWGNPPHEFRKEGEVVSTRMRYCVQWKDIENSSKGTLWTYMQQEAKDFAQVPNLEDGMKYAMSAHRPQVCMRGTKWNAIWPDGTIHTIRSSPQATKPLMASIAKRWGNPPEELQREGGKAFNIHNMKIKNHSYVYLVKLLTFEETREGAFYYKIGKANSIPKRIKQFGPCELVKSIKCSKPETALQVEASLHKLFNIYRKPDTEIFLLSEQGLALVVSQFANFESTAQECENI